MKQPYQQVATLFPTTDDSIITKINNHLNVLKVTINFKIRIIYKREKFLNAKVLC